MKKIRLGGDQSSNPRHSRPCIESSRVEQTVEEIQIDIQIGVGVHSPKTTKLKTTDWWQGPSSMAGSKKALPQDVPWRAAGSNSIPRIHHSPLLKLPLNPTSRYGIAVMRVFCPIPPYLFYCFVPSFFLITNVLLLLLLLLFSKGIQLGKGLPQKLTQSPPALIV